MEVRKGFRRIGVGIRIHDVGERLDLSERKVRLNLGLGAMLVKRRNEGEKVSFVRRAVLASRPPPPDTDEW